MRPRFFHIMICVIIFLCFPARFVSNAFGEESVLEEKTGLEQGKRIYSISCILCHGSQGKGDGPASVFIGPYSHPRPNDFTRGVFKYRTTESGDLPTLSDLMRTIRYGIPGYMPSFKHLGEEGIKQTALYIVNQFVQEELPTQAMDALNGLDGLNARGEILTGSHPSPDSAEAARIEVYKGITVILNDIAQSSLTAIEKEENPEPALNIYKQIIPLLNSIVGNLESNHLLLTNQESAVNNADLEEGLVPAETQLNQGEAAVSLDRHKGVENNFDAGQTKTTSPAFSALFIGEGDLAPD